MAKQNWLTIASIAFLIGGFLCVVQWFDIVDVYHEHFFEPGLLLVTYNFFRIVFVCFLAWLIYAMGWAVISAAAPTKTMRELPLAERVIFGFGTGLGVWHLLLLVLGVLELYYRSLMIGLCLIVLFASAKHFTQFTRDLGRSVADHFKTLRQRESIVLTTAGFLVVLAGFWLLLVRGLYPGGAGDYYTHYFYYYSDVIRNHGLQPNDAWYHYYYSKGAGLFFLGIMLTDAEAPGLITFCCVAFAALALAALSNRVAPKSLWPIFGAGLYLVFYVVVLSKAPWGPGGSGEFQKSHEKLSAFTVIITWAVCMYRIQPRLRVPCLITAASATIGAAILTQAMGVLLAVFFGLSAGWALVRRRLPQFWTYGLICASAGATVAGVLLLNYLVTGLATDQALNLTWQFANLERLDEWGVIPQLVVVAWIRDNYELLVLPLLSWGTIDQLRNFVRLDALWVLLGGGFVALGFTAIHTFRISRGAGNLLKRAVASTFSLIKSMQPEKERRAAQEVLVGVGSMIGIFLLFSVFAGKSQAVSYYRFCTFFFPLFTLFTVAWFGILIQGQRGRSFDSALRVAFPCILLFGTFVLWESQYDWVARARSATHHALKFASGQYSLSEAYSNQDKSGAHPFGGINPGALAAMRQVAPGTRIWSTNVDSYCMVPGCRMESVVSLKMSRRLTEILNGSPDRARQILEEEGLNYFLFSKEYPLLDMLPYSRLFAFHTIREHLAIKWTDGATYLLTWPGPDTTPIGEEFLQAYREQLEKPEHPWFRFSHLLPHIDTVLTTLRESPHPWRPVDFPWRKADGIDVMTVTYGGNCTGLGCGTQAERKDYTDGIDVISATYGGNCASFKPEQHSGNATAALSDACVGEVQCGFLIDVNRFGDPAKDCRKDFAVTYRCPLNDVTKEASIAAEANGKTIILDCGTESTQNDFADGIGYLCPSNDGTKDTSIVAQAHGKTVTVYCGTESRQNDFADGIDYLCPSNDGTKKPLIATETHEKAMALFCGTRSRQKEYADGIDVISATYGKNCANFRPVGAAFNVVRPGNAAAAVKDACAGESRCEFLVDVNRLGDPASGCEKDFSVTYRCPSHDVTKETSVAAEAHGKTVTLHCETTD